MNDQQYFQTTSLAYQLKAAQRELASFWSGEVYGKLKKVIAELLDLVASLKNRNAELDEKRKQGFQCASRISCVLLSITQTSLKKLSSFLGFFKYDTGL